MAAADRLTIDIEGVGGHAARPHLAIDTVLVGAQIINELQSIVSRNVDPLDAAVISICVFQAGYDRQRHPADRALARHRAQPEPEVRDLLEKRLHEVVEGTARLYGAKAKLTYQRGYPVLENHERQTDFAAAVAGEIAGAENVETDMPPVMGAEDFSFMLEARPGAFIFVGNGDSAGLHHPAYDFNDEVIPIGTSYWVKLVETALRGSARSAFSASCGSRRHCRPTGRRVRCRGLIAWSSRREQSLRLGCVRARHAGRHAHRQLRRAAPRPLSAAGRAQVRRPWPRAAPIGEIVEARALDRASATAARNGRLCTTSTTAKILISRTCLYWSSTSTAAPSSNRPPAPLPRTPGNRGPCGACRLWRCA